jgi:predicted acyltransferase
MYGILGVLLGLAWSTVFPINKALWTSSFVLFTAGLAALTLAAVQSLGHGAWARPFLAFGANPILAYVGEELFGTLTFALMLYRGGHWKPVGDILYESCFLPFFPPPVAALLYALSFVAVWWPVMELLYRRKLILKV